MKRHFVLIDACVAAAHFAPKSTQSTNLRQRASTLLTGSSATMDVRFLIPNFCIAEVFAVFEKYRWGRTWNKHVKPAHVLTPREFAKARQHFGTAIHNGAKILQVELNRYHILCVDLVSPINNAYKIKRDRGAKKNVTPAKTYDVLIVAMSVWLKNQYGEGSFTLVTGDERMQLVVERAKSARISRPMKMHLTEMAQRVGLQYGRDLYPTVINLTSGGKSVLRERFADWAPAW